MKCYELVSIAIVVGLLGGVLGLYDYATAEPVKQYCEKYVSEYVIIDNAAVQVMRCVDGDA